MFPADGAASLDRSLEWTGWTLETLWPSPVPAYLAVQDGMSPASLSWPEDGLGGVFVGGTLEWKLATGATWVRWAHDRRIRCHIGRVGTPRRVHWAREIGADSIDSAFPLWSDQQFTAFCDALGVEMHEQLTLP